jgi:hypothetical protein
VQKAPSPTLTTILEYKFDGPTMDLRDALGAESFELDPPAAAESEEALVVSSLLSLPLEAAFEVEESAAVASSDELAPASPPERFILSVKTDGSFEFMVRAKSIRCASTGYYKQHLQRLFGHQYLLHVLQRTEFHLRCARSENGENGDRDWGMMKIAVFIVQNRPSCGLY